MPAIETRYWGRLAVPLVVAGVFGLAACGQATATPSGSQTGSTADGSAQAGSAPAGSGATGSGTSDFEAFRSCLAENGVTLPERGVGGTPPTGTDTPPAAAADGGTPPADGSTPPSGAPRAGGGSRGADGPGMNAAPPGVDAATWASAKEACADLMPTPPGGGGQGA